MLQEAERYYVKTCHELRLLAAPLPFKVSQGFCNDRSCREDNKCSGVISNQHYPLQVALAPLSPLQLPLPTPLKDCDWIADDSSDEKAEESEQYEKDDNKITNQLLSDGLLSLRLPRRTDAAAKVIQEKTNDIKAIRNTEDHLSTEQILLRKQRIMSLEYDVRKCISDVRAQQSQQMSRCTLSGSAPADKRIALASLDPNSDDFSPKRSLSIEERIQRGRMREWKRERFCNRKYEQLCVSVLNELEEREKTIASVREKGKMHPSMNRYSTKIANMSAIHE